MAKKCPKSLWEAISEEPERFCSYLDVDKIANSENPYQEFLRQFRTQFGSAQGLNLWVYVDKKYKILNHLYKEEGIQNLLPKQFKGPLKRKESYTFFGITPKKRKVKLKPVETSPIKPHIRKGKEVKGYNRNKSFSYSNVHNRFILTRRKERISKLMNEFNRRFKTSLSPSAIGSKRLRLLK